MTTIPRSKASKALEIIDSYLARAGIGGIAGGIGASGYALTTNPEYYVDGKGNFILDAEGNQIVKDTHDLPADSISLAGMALGLGSKFIPNQIGAVMNRYRPRK